MKTLMNLLGAVAVLTAMSAPAMADWDDWHHNRHWRHHENRVIIRDNDRVILRNYVTSHRYYCPPGTVARRFGCVARPNNVIFYRPGEYLPRSVAYTEVPYSISSRLAPPPYGAVYVRSGDDIYLMNRRDRTILDAINLFSGGFQ